MASSRQKDTVVFDRRRYDGMGISVAHSDGLIDDLGLLWEYFQIKSPQAPVLSRTTLAPPAIEDLSDGDRFLVPVGAGGDWSGLDGFIVELNYNAWQWKALAPREGMLAWVEDETQHVARVGGVWAPLAAAHTHVTLPTAGEKAALAGSAGIPSAANKYITEDDPRLAGLAGSGPQMVPLYVVIPDTGLETFPTVHAVDADGTATSSASWTIMHKTDYELSGTITARSVGLFLKWVASVTSGTGQLRWMISDGTEVVGSSPTGSAVDVLTTPKIVTTTEVEDKVAGQAPAASLPTGDFSLLLVGKPNSTGQTLQGKILSDSQLELGF